jgi:hypothetical protein
MDASDGGGGGDDELTFGDTETNPKQNKTKTEQNDANRAYPLLLTEINTVGLPADHGDGPGLESKGLRILPDERTIGAVVDALNLGERVAARLDDRNGQVGFFV